MLREFGLLLRTFLAERQGILPARDIFFDAPNADLVRRLPPRIALDAYLADLRENRRLRSNDRTRAYSTNGARVTESRAPAWVDAHYLITAWDPSRDPGDRERPLREHRLLQQVSGALLGHEPLTPTGVFGGAAPAAWADFADTELPLQILPPEGFIKISEFWTSMGLGATVFWKPLVYLVASVPLKMPDYPETPTVTTLSARLGQTLDAASRRLVPGTEEEWTHIGGAAVELFQPADAGAPPTTRPVPRARVHLRSPAGTVLQKTQADESGRFRFLLPVGGPSGKFVLAGLSRPLGEAVRPIEVPSPTGEYDLVFNPNNL